jgi:hypothetical protein
MLSVDENLSPTQNTTIITAGVVCPAVPYDRCTQRSLLDSAYLVSLIYVTLIILKIV